jgi:hypothetical protein
MGHYSNECRSGRRNQEAHSMDHFFVANMEQCHTITVAEQVEDADMYVPWSFDVHQLDVDLIEAE